MNTAEQRIEERQEFIQALDRRVMEFITLHNVAQTAVESLDLE